MALDPNSQLLVDTLEALPLLEGRFANIRLVNRISGQPKRGVLSLVFRAEDKVEGRFVALKFFDLDVAVAFDKYRNNAFARE
jgi:hypothetical protein